MVLLKISGVPRGDAYPPTAAMVLIDYNVYHLIYQYGNKKHHGQAE